MRFFQKHIKPVRVTLIILMGCLTFSLSAQRNNYYFYGKVLNRETHREISDVNIRFTGTSLGTSTNSKGVFSFFIDTIPVYMTVSHLGYETQRIWLDNSSASMMILLQPQTTMLHEVEIKAVNEPLPFFKDGWQVLWPCMRYLSLKTKERFLICMKRMCPFWLRRSPSSH